MKLGKKFLLILSVIGVIIVLTIILIKISYQLQLSLLLFKEKGCYSISSDGKWLVCADSNIITSNKPALDLYKTQFPYRRISLSLPSIDNNNGEGFYKPLFPFGWSPGENLFIVSVDHATKPDAIDFCIVKVQSNEVNCYSDSRQLFGLPIWSIKGDKLLYFVRLSDNSYEVTVLDDQARLLNKRIISESISPHSNEVIHTYNILWNDKYIFLRIGYQINNNPFVGTANADRTAVYRISTFDENENIQTLMDQSGDYALVSIDPGGEYLLLTNGNDSIGNNIQIRYISDGKLFKEIPISLLDNQKNFMAGGVCLYDCNKTTLDITTDKSILIVWDWAGFNYKTYMDYEYAYGRLFTRDGFLCNAKQASGSEYTWLELCK
jgi:hypothetical protein